MKTDLFQSCGHCWVFQICWHIECSTFTPSSFGIWNSSTGILSPPLALFIVMLSKAHLTSHSRMSGSRWGITPSWLSGSWRSFFVQFLLYHRLLNVLLIPLCCVYALSLSHVQLFMSQWTIACQAPLSMEFYRQEYWSGLPCTPPGNLSNSGIELRSPKLQADS